MHELIKRIDLLAKDILTHPAWGFDHALRIEGIALEIAESEGFRIDREALHIAAMFHDFGAYEPYKRAGLEHSVCSAEFAGSWLRANKVERAKILLIKDIIMGHMFYSEPDISIREAVVLHDADVLDLLGTVGIRRMHSCVGLKDGATDMGEANRILRAFMEKLPPTLVTETAKRAARPKLKEMNNFFRENGI